MCALIIGTGASSSGFDSSTVALDGRVGSPDRLGSHLPPSSSDTAAAEAPAHTVGPRQESHEQTGQEQPLKPRAALRITTPVPRQRGYTIAPGRGA